MTDFGIVIPARYASTRLPGKPLRSIVGKPMIQWVVESARKAGAKFVWVATDDERIRSAVQDFGGEVVMTSGDHATGTDRLAEVMAQKGVSPDTIIVNVQGDEPLISASSIQHVARALADCVQAGIATMAHPITSVEDLFNTNVVKVVLDASGLASYFSRAPIPWARDAFASGKPSTLPAEIPFLRHVGLYAYRASALTELANLPRPYVEQAESLEQLRALYGGIKIHVSIIHEAPAAGVDTEEDLVRVEQLLRAAAPRDLDSLVDLCPIGGLRPEIEN